MYIGSSKLTFELDQRSIQSGFSEIVLMENAAEAAFKRIKKIEDSLKKTSGKDFGFKNITVVSGVGNNGGDGLAISRRLILDGKNVKTYVVGRLDKMTESSYANLQILRSMRANLYFLDGSIDKYGEDFSDFEDSLTYSDAVIDCIFGVGLNRDVTGIYKDIILSINNIPEKIDKKIFKKNKPKVISIDIASGYDADTGDICGVCVDADYTISFEYFKKGFLRYDNKKVLGKIFVEKIGIIESIYDEIKDEYLDCDEKLKNVSPAIIGKFIDEEFVLGKLIEKNSYSNKGNFGRATLFAGQQGMYGAAYMCTRACSKAGAGLVTLISSDDVVGKLSTRLTEEMSLGLGDRKGVENILGRTNSVGFGCGFGKNESTKAMLRSLIENNKFPLVVDADGLDIFEEIYSETENFHIDKDVVLTPHLGEFSRMSGLSIDEINSDRISHAKNYALSRGIILVLKGENTIVTDGRVTMVNSTGNKAMANGGMGDTLTGIVTSFMAQGYTAFEASCIGVYVHGLCGDEIFKKNNNVMATQVIEKLPKIIKKLYKKKMMKG